MAAIERFKGRVSLVPAAHTLTKHGLQCTPGVSTWKVPVLGKPVAKAGDWHCVRCMPVCDGFRHR
jgi:hypothetical protein